MIMEERFVTVKLLGELGRKFGREYRFLVRSPRDVISALSRQVDGFKEYLCMAHENNVGFKLVTPPLPAAPLALLARHFSALA